MIRITTHSQGCTLVNRLNSHGKSEFTDATHHDPSYGFGVGEWAAAIWRILLNNKCVEPLFLEGCFGRPRGHGFCDKAFEERQKTKNVSTQEHLSSSEAKKNSNEEHPPSIVMPLAL